MFSAVFPRKCDRRLAVSLIALASSVNHLGRILVVMNCFAFTNRNDLFNFKRNMCNVASCEAQ